MTTQKNYKETVNLPQTPFPMKANLAQREPEFLKKWKEGKIYERVRAKRKGAKKFTLHDGPPYANGNIHIGHALNKVLKDMIVKYKTLRGMDSHYVPGWDCHGLPIELAALKEMGKRKEEVERVQFRKECRKYAAKYIEIQKKDFERLGVFGDWETPYLTMNPPYQAAIAESFLNLFEKNYIERRLKPVPWCFDCETALADAELEYEDRNDKTVYVTFPYDGKYSFVVWTTTPWTLPANVGLAFNPNLDYVFVQTSKGNFILAEKLLGNLQSLLQWEGEKIEKKVKGKELAGTEADHPFLPRKSKGILADYVSDTDGTGIVHIAPGHGEEDYLYGNLENHLPILSPVDSRGKFIEEADVKEKQFVMEYPEFKGVHVFKGNALITDLLRNKGRLLMEESYSHSYPHCWRCKNPIIFRATPQWFMKIDHNDLRNKMKNEIEHKIRFIPDWGKNRIGSMVDTRPDWCLSRQRFWGVPIPILFCKTCGKTSGRGSIDKAIKETAAVRAKVKEIFTKENADAWFARPAGDFLPAGYKCECGSAEFEKEKDIIDVWFDSGVSHEAVLKGSELNYPADLYLEGSDQHRGWFQSSLTTGVALEGHPPFHGVLTHGFVVDGEGKKMSKSAGNVIVPQDVIKELGADVLRLWVSSCDYQYDVRLSKEILSRMVEAYRRIRNTFRYLLGNLFDFDPVKDAVPPEKMDGIDQWAMAKYSQLIDGVTKHYDAYEFYQIYKLIHQFCTVTLSNFYLDALKDRMYTAAPKSLKRRSSQTAFFHILSGLARMLSPILPFTCEEVWSSFKFDPNGGSVHEADWPRAEGKAPASVVSFWDDVLLLRDFVNEVIEKDRAEGKIGSSLEAKIILGTQDAGLKDKLRAARADLSFAFVVSEVEAADQGEGARNFASFFGVSNAQISVQVAKAGGSKCERCWNYSAAVGANPEHPTICDKCVKSLAERGSLS